MAINEEIISTNDGAVLKRVKRDGVCKLVLNPTVGRCPLGAVSRLYEKMKELNAVPYLNEESFKFATEKMGYDNVVIMVNGEPEGVVSKETFLKNREKYTFSGYGEYLSYSFIGNANSSKGIERSERQITQLRKDAYIIESIDIPSKNVYNLDEGRKTTPVYIEL